VTATIGPPPGYTSTPCTQLSAHQPHGEGDHRSGWWCPGIEGPQSPEQLLAELEATPVVELTTQEELLTALDELLDSAVHSDECYVNPDDTVCFCVIGKVRAVLPRCPVWRPPPSGEGPLLWRCQRTAHPAAPDRHVFGVV
jgi:hypothetical protein